VLPFPSLPPTFDPQACDRAIAKCGARVGSRVAVSRYARRIRYATHNHRYIAVGGVAVTELSVAIRSPTLNRAVAQNGTCVVLTYGEPNSRCNARHCAGHIARFRSAVADLAI